MNARKTLRISEKKHLEIGGCDTVQLAQEFGTPLYVFDEEHIRSMMRVYRETFEREYNGKGIAAYASKAFSCLAIYALAAQEQLAVDVVSGGELYTALKAGFPSGKIFMHGNNKLYSELEFAISNKVGTIVVDSYREADFVDELAAKYNIKQNVLVRINPGIEAHTHAFIQTARTDSKFGFSVSDGAAEKIVSYILSKKNIVLKGYHCHIGSQIFEKQSFILAAEKVMDFVAEIKSNLGFEAETVNMGGGFGIWYNDEDPKLSPEAYAEYLECLINTVKRKAAEHSLKLPYLVVEPGRSIIGEAGITLYTVGAIKEIEGLKKYIAVDGGMFDNPRYALYQSKYTVLLANRADEPCTEKVTIAGKCCESGDIIAVDVALPRAESGDILAVLSTGAYNYSMASNYNRNSVPPAVFVKEGKAEYVVKPQTLEDIIRNDVIPQRLINNKC